MTKATMARRDARTAAKRTEGGDGPSGRAGTGAKNEAIARLRDGGLVDEDAMRAIASMPDDERSVEGWLVEAGRRAGMGSRSLTATRLRRIVQDTDDADPMTAHLGLVFFADHTSFDADTLPAVMTQAVDDLFDSFSRAAGDENKPDARFLVGWFRDELYRYTARITSANALMRMVLRETLGAADGEA